MQNSLIVFLAFVGFLAFGYVSLLRILAKQHLSPSEGEGLFSKTGFLFLLRNLGSSAFFVSLPATALLLFWGWGPALIWLIFFHLFLESVFHLQFGANEGDSTVADFLLRTDSGPTAFLEQGLIQAFFLLSMAVVVALVATLLDRQPGVLFALLFLLPARNLLSHSNEAIPKALRALGAIGLLALGLAFSDQLGFSVYGDWAPLGQFVPWLVFNMPTLLAAIIVVSVFKLETNTGFKNDLSTFAGLIIAALTLILAFKLIWLQPILDAPMNATQVQSEQLPNFIFVSLFIFTGFAAFLVRLLNEEGNDSAHSKGRFHRLQTDGLVHTIYMAILVISLAAALGIGAWKTHFIDWSLSLNILDYLNLSISSTLNLVYEYADSGAKLHTALLAALCFTGFSFLLMCANQLTLEESETESLWTVIVEAKLLQAFGVFILSAYFIGNGISVNAWLLIGVLAWAIFTHLVIGMCLAKNNNILFTIMTLATMAVGSMQILALSLYWFGQSNYLLICLNLIILLTATLLWRKDVVPLIKNLSRSEQSSFL
ncbi:hypothetical protein NBRC116583_36710 [Arenicella sp. 4NH20-0111]|uniref:hypothetical protein n=1 Tax=Arenicella sp. 4NH20-0111 TaxID=3127648 RepID=UPI0031021A1E